MKQERMKILTLLEEGKITADEATKLLDVLKGTSGFDTRSFNSGDVEERLSRFSQAVDALAKEIGGKMGNTFKDVEPKVKKATKAVFEKTASIVDDISKTLNENIKKLEEDCDDPATDCGCGCEAVEEIVEEIKEEIKEESNEI